MDASLVDKAITCIGLVAEFRSNNNDNIFRISLSSDKATICGGGGPTKKTHIVYGLILHSEIDELIGHMPFSQTAIFGMFGRTILRRLYK